MSSHTAAHPDFDVDDELIGEDPFATAPAALLDDEPFISPSVRSAFEPAEDFAPAQDSAAETAAAPSSAASPPLSSAQVETLLREPDPAPYNPAQARATVPDTEPVTGEAGVPRIGIHVFCLNGSTRDAAEKAAADRRLQRADTRIFAGGLTGALEHYADANTPALVIVESDKGSAEMLTQLDQLAEVCDAGTKVIVVGGFNDIALYRELMRRGVSEYLVAPLQTLGLIRAVTGLFADPANAFVGRSIAFVGAKGGVGASTIAHNIGFAISDRMMSPAVIVDFDLPFGTAGLDFNQDPLQGVADALSQPDRLDSTLLERMMVRCTERLSLFAAPATLDSTYDISAEAFEEVANKIRTTAPFVVLDLPHVWSSWMRQMLLGADDVVIVATPDLASLRNAKNLFDLIRSARPNDAPPRLVLNQVGVPGRPEIPVKDFANALGVEPSLVLPFDPKSFGQAANNGQMLLEGGAKSKAAEGLIHLAQLISKREAPPQRAKGLLDNILKRKA